LHGFHRLALPAICATALSLSCAPREAAPPRNLLVITLDTIRADHLGCHGYFRDTSPRLDAFARDALFFTRCLAPISTTLPAHVSLFTGVDPYEHGILANPPRGENFDSSAGLTTLAEDLRAAGYRTAAFVSGAPLKRESGIETGFGHFDQPDGAERRAGETNAAFFAWFTGAGGPGAAGQRDIPSFIWIHYYDPHAPYSPPAPFDSLYAPDTRLDAFLGARRMAYCAESSLSAREAAGLYDGEVRYMDEQIGLLLDRLEQEGWLREAAVVIVGDHGEGLCQHGMMGHGHIFGEQLHVPLMMRVPGEAPRRIETLCSLIDVLPTLAGRMPGLPGPAVLAQASGTDVLAPGPAREGLLARNSALDERRSGGVVHALTTGQWKYVETEDEDRQLYDLERDPYELTDSADRFPGESARLSSAMRALIAWQQNRRQAFRRAPSDSTRALSPEMIEQLRSLGYVD